MTLRVGFRPACSAALRGPALLTALLLAASLLGTPAHAFTFNNPDGSSGSDANSGFTGYKDLDTRARAFGSDPADKYTAQQGKSGLSFGAAPQSFDQRYSADRMFSPNVLSGR